MCNVVVPDQVQASQGPERTTTSLFHFRRWPKRILFRFCRSAFSHQSVKSTRSSSAIANLCDQKKYLDSVVTTSSVRCIADRLRNHGSQHKSCLISNASHASVVSSGWKQVLPWLEALVRGQTPPSLSCSNSWPACK